MFQDAIGNAVQEGDLVAVPLDGGEMGVGFLEKVSGGLVQNPNQVPQRVAIIKLSVTRPVLPNGQIANVFALKDPRPPQTETAKAASALTVP